MFQLNPDLVDLLITFFLTLTPFFPTFFFLHLLFRFAGQGSFFTWLCQTDRHLEATEATPCSPPISFFFNCQLVF